MIKVRVPATSANFGPGFDSLGIALSLYNTFTFEEIHKGIEIIGCSDEFNNDNNLVYTAMTKTLDYIGYKLKGIRITVEANIPVSRGLGSSAACIVGGVMGANELTGNTLSKDELLSIATSIEGHPDNVAPAIFGGLVASTMVNEGIIHNNVNLADGLKFVALIPDFTLSTSEARSVLPKNIEYKDAIYNVSRVSLLLSALSNGRFDLLKIGIGDRLHQPYRGELIPEYQKVLEICNNHGSLGTFLSGAGPTVMSIVHETDNNFINDIRSNIETLENKWIAKELFIDYKGAGTEGQVNCPSNYPFLRK